MTNLEKSAASVPPGTNRLWVVRGIDLAALVLSLLGICLFFGAVLVMAVVEVARLVSNFWASPVDRWLVIIFGLAAIWVAARWKKLSAQ